MLKIYLFGIFREGSRRERIFHTLTDSPNGVGQDPLGLTDLISGPGQASLQLAGHNFHLQVTKPACLCPCTWASLTSAQRERAAHGSKVRLLSQRASDAQHYRDYAARLCRGRSYSSYPAQSLPESAHLVAFPGGLSWDVRGRGAGCSSANVPHPAPRSC